MFTNRQVGIGMMAVAVALLLSGAFYIWKTEEFILSQATIGPGGECQHAGQVCPYEQLNRLAVPKYVGGFLLLGLFGSGLFLFFRKRPEQVSGRARKALKGLGGDEARVFELVIQNEGMLFQNELVEKSQLGKVKVTRLLDKLEAKGLVERRRRGMTNVIILKQ